MGTGGTRESLTGPLRQTNENHKGEVLEAPLIVGRAALITNLTSAGSGSSPADTSGTGMFGNP